MKGEFKSKPSSWKLGEIVPAHKKDCMLTKTNYRPITILPLLSKVFEKLVHSRLASHFGDVYHNNVFAYRDYHGCDTAICSLTDNDSRKNQIITKLLVWCLWICQKHLTCTLPMILLSKSLKITEETQKVHDLYQPRYKLFK